MDVVLRNRKYKLKYMYYTLHTFLNKKDKILNNNNNNNNNNNYLEFELMKFVE
jgi:hypothetical protein